MPLLAIDVGAGTQDILLYREEVPLEASLKMVLPSRTVTVAGKIDGARLCGRDVFLTGPTMGGGASTAALRRNLAAGLRVYATPSAAGTINDNLERVARMGVVIQDEAPASADIIRTGDIDITVIREAFGLFDIPIPNDVAVAVQDHGFSPDKSNRLVRFEHMADAIAAGGTIDAFAYRNPPKTMTRMLAAKAYLEREGFKSVLMDTGPAAVFGASSDSRCVDPALVINFGNGHTIVALLDKERITALFEHHTSRLSSENFRRHLSRFCAGGLKSSEIFEDGGHGAYIEYMPQDIESIIITGPKRCKFQKHELLRNAVAAAPGGDMMITGCIGLLNAWSRKECLWR
jgi:uncharacterized protein (DUF1786 family)